MKKVLLSLAAVSAIATVATPAAAAPAWYYGRGNVSYADNQMNHREAQISRQLKRLERRGVISVWEERSLRHELARIEIREKAYRRSGDRLTHGEIADIHARLDRLEARLQYVRHEGPQYGYGYGNGYGYGDRW
jgi:hypothetical protein